MKNPDQARGSRRHRGMYILPSVFTAGNIAAGYYAITQSLQGSIQEPHHFDFAALAIGFAIPFDAIDGRIARMTNTTSDFGKELDSLADVITFGVAPSILAFSWGFHMLPVTMDPWVRERLVQLGGFACFLFLICGACRLARFNISNDPLPKNPGRPGRKYFVGMPIPAAAGVIAAVVHGFQGHPFNWWTAILWLLLVGLVGLSYGEYLALLERQRDQPVEAASSPLDRADGAGNLPAGLLFTRGATADGSRVYVLGYCGAGGICPAASSENYAG